MNLSFRYRFEAAHRFVHAASPMCQTPHGHTWYVSLKLRATEPQLSKENMVVEFKQLKSQWKKFVQEELDHSFFYNQNDPVVPTLKQHIPGFRGFPIPGDPTTEMLAVLFLRKAQMIFSQSAVEVSEILLEETPVNSIALSVTDPIFVNTIEKLKSESWWNLTEIDNRSLKL